MKIIKNTYGDGLGSSLTVEWDDIKDSDTVIKVLKTLNDEFEIGKVSNKLIFAFGDNTISISPAKHDSWEEELKHYKGDLGDFATINAFGYGEGISSTVNLKEFLNMLDSLSCLKVFLYQMKDDCGEHKE